MNTLIMQTVLERLVSLLRCEIRHHLVEHGLQPVQFDALYYLSVCNRYSDTPKAVTEFLGLTKGTVSQSIKVLENKGLVVKIPDKEDKRVTHLQVTIEGKQLIEKLMPSVLLNAYCEESGQQEQQAIIDMLTGMLRRIQEMHGFKTFGQCSTCTHNLKKSEREYFCNLTQEPLTPAETKLICREHELPQT